MRTNKGGLNVIGKRLLNTPWEKISDGTRDIIAKNSGQNQAAALDRQAQAATENVAKEALPFENRFVVKDDITGSRVEWQALNPAGGWKVQTTFDNIEAATAAVASSGIDPAGVSVWDSAWNANAKRFTPAKKREAEMQASAATAAPQAETAPAAATQQAAPVAEQAAP
ncbi:MAG TPA: hypothetical protein PLB24_12250, partial [Comamonas denitrificans]|nr:hypothetical protein [Comamonas denitrificans]